MSDLNSDSDREVQRVDDVTLAWNKEEGSLSFFGLPAVTFWLAPSLRNLLRPLVDEMGVERYRALVSEHASLGTDEDYHAMVTVLADNFVEGFLAWGRAVGIAGWGRFELERFDVEAGEARVAVHHAWELRMHPDPGLGWGCPFMEGKLTGIFGHALGGRCVADEQVFDDHVVFDIRRVDREGVAEDAPARMPRIPTPEGTPLAREPKAVAALEAVGALAGGIAHNFNNRLASILGCVSMAQNRSGDPAELARLLGLAEGHIGRARQLTQQLLTFSTGGDPIRRAVNVGELVRVVSAREVGRRPCQLRVEEGLTEVSADPDQLEQAVAELLRNAVQASPPEGAIAVEVRRTEIDGGPAIRISVGDNGKGMCELSRRRAVELFFTTKPGAAGLGLSVAYSVANRHDGTLHFDSDEGGTVFHLTVPAVPAVETGEAARSLPEGLRVLLIDDHPDVLEVGRDMLEALGCEAVCADEGTRGCECFADAALGDAAFAVVILDLMLPGELGGVATFEALRRSDPDVRVVVSSGYHDDPVMADFRRHGMRAVLPKPYTLDDLKAALMRALE